MEDKTVTNTCVRQFDLSFEKSFLVLGLKLKKITLKACSFLCNIAIIEERYLVTCMSFHFSVTTLSEVDGPQLMVVASIEERNQRFD